MQNINCLQQKVLVYNFLQRPRGFVALSYHIFVSLAVFICLVLTVFITIKEYESSSARGLVILDCVIFVIFSIEFVARFWSSSCIYRFRGWKGKLYFLINPFRIIDLFVIISSALDLFMQSDGHIFSLSLSIFRFFQVFPMLRLDKRFKPWRVMASVVWDQREQLAITYYMAFLALLFTSGVVYLAEKDYNPGFDNLAEGMWWAVVTLTTVGYGDIVPVTPVGKFMTCVFVLIGVCIFALPAGIIGTGLALKVDEQRSERQLSKRRLPACKLIQCGWRWYAADQCQASVTWKRHLYPNSKYWALTNADQNAIRFIRRAKYESSRREFAKVLKPYHINDVLEQYAAGHQALSASDKLTHSRLDNMQNALQLNAKRVDDSIAMLNKRLTLIDIKVGSFERKLNELFKRKRRRNSL